MNCDKTVVADCVIQVLFMNCCYKVTLTAWDLWGDPLICLWCWNCEHDLLVTMWWGKFVNLQMHS
jgi:hypothetical protein